MPDDEAVIGATAYRYAHEVIVEVTCRGADDDLVVYSYAFRSDDDGELRPAGTVPDRHCEVVADALAEKDVEPATDFRGAAG